MKPVVKHQHTHTWHAFAGMGTSRALAEKMPRRKGVGQACWRISINRGDFGVRSSSGPDGRVQHPREPYSRWDNNLTNIGKYIRILEWYLLQILHGLSAQPITEAFILRAHWVFPREQWNGTCWSACHRSYPDTLYCIISWVQANGRCGQELTQVKGGATWTSPQTRAFLCSGISYALRHENGVGRGTVWPCRQMAMLQVHSMPWSPGDYKLAGERAKYTSRRPQTDAGG